MVTTRRHNDNAFRLASPRFSRLIATGYIQRSFRQRNEPLWIFPSHLQVIEIFANTQLSPPILLMQHELPKSARAWIFPTASAHELRSGA
jgi:hypothetical protein